MLKGRILKLASEMFHTFGLKAVSMDDIAKKVGISKRTLYETFSSKDELLTHCIRVKQDESISEMMAIINDAKKDFVEVVLGLLSVISRDVRKINALFFVDLDRYNLQSAFEENEIKAMEKRKIVISMLQKGIDEGYVKSDLNLELMVELLLTRQPILGLFSRVHHTTLDEIVNNVCLINIRGISTLKGIERIDKLVEDIRKDKRNR